MAQSGADNNVRIEGSAVFNLGNLKNTNLSENLSAGATTDVYAKNFANTNFFLDASHYYSSEFLDEKTLSLKTFSAEGSSIATINFHQLNASTSDFLLPNIYSNFFCSPANGETSEPEEAPTLEPIELGTTSALVDHTDSIIDTPSVVPTSIF